MSGATERRVTVIAPTGCEVRWLTILALKHAAMKNQLPLPDYRPPTTENSRCHCFAQFHSHTFGIGAFAKLAKRLVE